MQRRCKDCIWICTVTFAKRSAVLNNDDRSGVLIRPKQPYVDWTASLSNSSVALNPQDEPTLYLMHAWGSDAEAIQRLADVFDVIFKNELASWHRHELDWPSHRSFEMFCAWFDVTFVSCIEDIENLRVSSK